MFSGLYNKSIQITFFFFDSLIIFNNDSQYPNDFIFLLNTIIHKGNI